MVFLNFKEANVDGNRPTQQPSGGSRNQVEDGSDPHPQEAASDHHRTGDDPRRVQQKQHRAAEEHQEAIAATLRNHRDHRNQTTLD